MANVPIYNEPKVADRHIAQDYKRVNLNADMFGANVLQAVSDLGKTAANLGANINKKADEWNKTKIVDITNQLDSYTNTALYDKDNGYFYKTGSNAMGQSEQVMADYDAYAQELIDNSNLKGEYLTMAQNAIIAKRNKIFPSIQKHDADETKSWQSSVYSQKEANFLNQAILDRNDDKLLAENLAQGYNVIDLQAQLQDWDEATVDLKKKDFASKYHIAVINGLLGDGSLRAKQYYEAHKNDIDPNKHNQILNAVNSNEMKYKAAQNAEQMSLMPLNDAYKFLDNIENIYERNETEREYNRLLNRKENMIKQQDAAITNDLMNQFYEVLQSGDKGDMSQFLQDVYASGLSPEMLDKMVDKVKTYQEVGQYITNWGHKQFLEDMAAYNADVFKTVNLAEYDLSKSDYEHFANMQRNIGTEQYNNQTNLKKAIDKIDTNLFGLGTKDVPNSNFYKSELFNIFNKIERMQGKAINIKDLDSGQIRTLIDAFNYKADVQDKDIDEFKELYIKGRQYSEFYNTVAENYQQFKRLNKREPSPEEMYDMTRSSYVDLEKQYRKRANTNLVNGMNLFVDVNNTLPKVGETKVLTYFAETELPRMANKLGLKLNYVDGARYREGDLGGHGKGKKFDLSMSEHSQTNRVAILEEVLANPLVLSVGTSDRLLLERFKGNLKLVDFRNWDKEKGAARKVNHINHLDITLNTRFGGETQGTENSSLTVAMQRPDGKIVNVPTNRIEQMKKEYKYKRL